MESDSSVENWMEVFPEPSTSPAHYTLTLTIFGLPLTDTPGKDPDHWIRASHNIECLHVIGHDEFDE